MKIIKTMPDETINAYSPIQDCGSTVPAGYLIFPDKFMDTFYPSDKRAAGFVTIEHDGHTATSCTWNEEAYQAWATANPEQPSEPSPITQTQLALAELAETESAHDIENKLALAELAEMIGGTSNG